MTDTKRTRISAILVIAMELLLCRWLLGSDAGAFLTWWLLAALLGLIGMPVAGMLFSGFEDKGWMFSKVLAIAVTGYLEWLLVTTKAFAFSTITCVAVVGICGVAAVAAFSRQAARGEDCLPSRRVDLVLWEEAIFVAVFLLWTYLAGFNAAAHGTEKFMDYGFMEAMMRSSTLPPKDMWYSEGVLNYYYGGQYFAVFLTKLSSCRVEQTYNLMRTFVAAFAFTLPFSLVYQMVFDHRRKMRAEGKAKGAFAAAGPALAGLMAGTAVCIAGNMHYVVYRWILPFIQKMRVEEVTGYWFPDATRYIGHNPPRPDQTIHEFPCYSFVLGDLHAHVVNIPFVLLMAGLLYAWLQGTKHLAAERRQLETAKAMAAGQDLSQPDLPGEAGPVLTKNDTAVPQGGESMPDHAKDTRERPVPVMNADAAAEMSAERDTFFPPYLLVAGFLLGLYQLNNYWDFVIYFVVAVGAALFVNILEQDKVRTVLGKTIGQAVLLYVLSYLVMVPFKVLFKTMVDGVAVAQNHSYLYQLAVLWGLPVLLGGYFVIAQILQHRTKKGKPSLSALMGRMENQDLFAVLMYCCAFGLILIPELVYVRDIYESSGNARANTMFKLTYQAFMLFGMTMGYVVFRTLISKAGKRAKAFVSVGLVLFCLTVGYFGNCVNSWFGGFRSPRTRAGLNATAFLYGEFAEDVGGIDWLKANVEEQPVTLEANGDSYTDFCRVSAMTGLPTVVGWFVHEWLWRGDTTDLNQKVADIQTIYTSSNAELVGTLLKQYHVSYIFVGEKEREKFGDDLNTETLSMLGQRVYEDPDFDTFILQVY